MCGVQNSQVNVQEDVSRFGQKGKVTFLCYCDGNKPQLLNVVIEYHWKKSIYGSQIIAKLAKFELDSLSPCG